MNNIINFFPQKGSHSYFVANSKFRYPKIYVIPIVLKLHHSPIAKHSSIVHHLTGLVLFKNFKNSKLCLHDKIVTFSVDATKMSNTVCFVQTGITSEISVLPFSHRPRSLSSFPVADENHFPPPLPYNYTFFCKQENYYTLL